MHRKVKKSVQSFHGSPQQFCSLHFLCRDSGWSFRHRIKTVSIRIFRQRRPTNWIRRKRRGNLMFSWEPTKSPENWIAFWKMERRACFPIFRIRVCWMQSWWQMKTLLLTRNLESPQWDGYSWLYFSFWLLQLQLPECIPWAGWRWQQTLLACLNCWRCSSSYSKIDSMKTEWTFWPGAELFLQWPQFWSRFW